MVISYGKHIKLIASTSVSFGANLSVAAGPVGRSAEGAGTVGDFAPIYAYSKTKG